MESRRQVHQPSLQFAPVTLSSPPVRPDPWEREGEDTQYFFQFSPDAYAAGIDVVLYAMTH
jgi:hypothetical protein